MLQTGWMQIWRDHRESSENVHTVLIHSPRRVNITKVFFFLPHMDVHATNSPKRITTSVNKCLGWPSNPADLVPFHSVSCLSEGNQLSNKTNIKKTGIYKGSFQLSIIPHSSWERSVCWIVTSDAGIACIHLNPTHELCLSFIFNVFTLEGIHLLCILTLLDTTFYLVQEKLEWKSWPLWWGRHKLFTFQYRG